MTAKFAIPKGRTVHMSGQFPGDAAYIHAVSPLGNGPGLTPAYRMKFPTIGPTPRQPDIGAFRAVCDGILQWMRDGHMRGMSPHLDLDLRDGEKFSTIPDILAGKYDEWVKAIGEAGAEYQFPMLWRIGGEGTSPHERQKRGGGLVTPAEFVAAYRRVWGLLEVAGANKGAAHCWCIEVGSGDPDFRAYFPGHDVVDFVGLDLFRVKDLTLPQTLDFLAWAKAEGLQVGIMEASCVEFDIGPSLVSAEQVWEGYFAPMFAFVAKHDIRWWTYINHTWAEGGNGWRSGRIDGNPFLVAKLIKELRKDRWIHAPQQAHPLTAVPRGAAKISMNAIKAGAIS